MLIFCTKSLKQKVKSAPFRKLQIDLHFARTRPTNATVGAKGFFSRWGAETWLKCTWVKWKSTFSKNSLPSTRPKSLLHAGTNRDILDLHVYHFRIVLHIRKALRIGRDKLYIVSGFEELVSQNTYFGICIFCPSAVLILVLGLSHGGNGLLWHWIYSFQFRFIHFVSFRKIQK